MKNLEIIDNFLDEKDYQQIYAIMLSPNFGWHVQIGKTYYADFSKQLTHLFYDNNRPNSEFFDLLNPIRSKLNCETIIREKANLTFYNDLEDPIKLGRNANILKIGNRRKVVAVLLVNSVKKEVIMAMINIRVNNSNELKM